jgi:hypothetical protein
VPWSFYIYVWQLKIYVDRPTFISLSLFLSRSSGVTMPDDLKDSILSIFEASLDAQLRAVRRLRSRQPEPTPARRRQGLSQVDLAYDILKEAGTPLHISELLARIHSTFHLTVDRESLVSSLSKKIARGDRFIRTDKNTFGLRPEAP